MHPEDEPIVLVKSIGPRIGTDLYIFEKANVYSLNHRDSKILTGKTEKVR